MVILDPVLCLGLNKNRAILYELLEDDLEKSIKELEVALTCVRAEERNSAYDADRYVVGDSFR